MTNSYHFPLAFLYLVPKSDLGAVVDKILDQISSPHETNLIITALIDTNIPNDSIIYERIRRRNFQNIYAIIDYQLEDCYKQSLAEFCREILEINYFPVLTKYSLNSSTKIWNYQSDQGLMIVGHLRKFNRIEFLRHLYDEKLLDPRKISWTFPKIPKSDVFDYYGHDKFSEFVDFCYTNSATVDTELFAINYVKEFFNSLSGMYADTSYSIISETKITMPFITEKTYRTIAHKHPFVLFGGAKTLEHLRKLGFRTFDQYFTYEYDSINNRKERLIAVTKNLAVMPEVIKSNRQSIIDDVEYNHMHYEYLADKNMDKLKDFCSKVALNFKDIETQFQLFDYYTQIFRKQYSRSPEEITTDRQQQKELYNQYLKLWLDTYKQIKADHWPDLNYPYEYDDLPAAIQKECVEVFNFLPFSM